MSQMWVHRVFQNKTPSTQRVTLTEASVAGGLLLHAQVLGGSVKVGHLRRSRPSSGAPVCGERRMGGREETEEAELMWMIYPGGIAAALMNSSNFNTSCVEVPRAVCSFVLLMWALGIHKMLKVMCATSRTSGRGLMV